MASDDDDVVVVIVVGVDVAAVVVVVVVADVDDDVAVVAYTYVDMTRQPNDDADDDDDADADTDANANDADYHRQCQLYYLLHHVHCSLTCHQMGQLFGPTLPADVFADDFGANAHDIDTADSSAAAPRPVYESVAGVTVGPTVDSTVAAAERPQTVDANCRLLAVVAVVVYNTAIWRDLRHAVNVT